MTIKKVQSYLSLLEHQLCCSLTSLCLAARKMCSLSISRKRKMMKNLISMVWKLLARILLKIQIILRLDWSKKICCSNPENQKN